MKKWQYCFVNTSSDKVPADLTEYRAKGWQVVPIQLFADTVILMERKITEQHKVKTSKRLPNTRSRCKRIYNRSKRIHG